MKTLVRTSRPPFMTLPPVAAAGLSRLLLLIAAGLPALMLIVLVLTFLFAASPANAATPLACGGTSLMDELAAEHPDRLAEARAEAGKVPNGEGLLWRVETEGQAPSWLFGTMHVTDPRVLSLPDKARKAVDGAETVVIETTDILDPEKAQMALLGNPELTMFTDGTTLASLLEPDELELVKAELDRRGIPLALVSKMKPWMIAGMVGLPDCEARNKAAGLSFLDEKIALDAKAAGKRVLGLETITEQLSAMESLPIGFHIQGLVETIRLGDLMPDISATMTELYLGGKIALIMPAIKAAAPEEIGDETEGYAEFEERVITMRNHVMAERATPIIDNGNAFIAVGALHLPGKEGVIELLRDAGYTVTRVD